MSFSDPIKVKADGTTETELSRVSVGNLQSEYRSSDGLIRVKVSSQENRRDRHTIRLDLSKITDNPYNTDQKEEVSSSVYLVIDKPKAGFTDTDMKKAVEGFVTFISASSYSAISKVLACES